LYAKELENAGQYRLFRLYPTEKANSLKDSLIEGRKKANEELLSDFTMEERVLLRRFLLNMAHFL